MSHYRFRGRDRNGQALSGVLEADSAEAVADQLINSGITPIDIVEAEAGTGDWRHLERLLTARRPDISDLALFCRQMHALLRSGVPISRALRSLTESSDNPYMTEALEDLIDSLEAGRDLSGSLARHPKLFSALFVNVVRVGETSGRLEDAFLRLYHYLTFQRQTRERVKVAFRYPIFVLIAVAIAVAIIVTVVVPPFAGIFERMGADLPLPTRIIIGVSDAAVGYWHWALGVLAAAVAGTRLYLRTEAGRLRWDQLKLRLPIIGPIAWKASLARFARSFSMCYRSGVPLIQALTLIARSLDNHWLGQRILEMRNGIERGESIARAARTTGLFTPLVLQMVAVGEETGRIDEMMDEVGDYYEQEVQAEVDNLSATLEPLLIVAVGSVVLVLALGVFLPMWDMYTLVNQ